MLVFITGIIIGIPTGMLILYKWNGKRAREDQYCNCGELAIDTPVIPYNWDKEEKGDLNDNIHIGE